MQEDVRIKKWKNAKESFFNTHAKPICLRNERKKNYFKHVLREKTTKSV